jgi:hypothetical protein
LSRKFPEVLRWEVAVADSAAVVDPGSLVDHHKAEAARAMMTEAEGLNANDFPEAILIDHRPMVIVCRAVLTAREGFPPPDLIR